MYRTTIEIKETVPDDKLKDIRNACIKAHQNRAGKVAIKDTSERSYVFEGGEEKYGCLSLGYLCLADTPIFTENVKAWYWEDEEPGESGDLIEALLKKRRHS